MILASHGIISNSGVSQFDADALSFITAASISDSTQQTAINTLVTDLKTYSIWTKMKAVYPFVGGSASSHKFNLKDPRDLDAAYRLTFNGGWTHSITGALPNGTTGYADTFCQDITNNSSLWYYSRTNNTNSTIEAGMYNSVYSDTLVSGYLTGSTFLGIKSAAGGYVSYTSTTTTGFFGANRTSNVLFNGWHNGIKKGTNTNTSSNDAITKNVWLGGYYSNSGLAYPSDKETAFASIGDGLSDTEAANFYTAVQTFQTLLSRNV
jgi:hypothetical protein